MVSEDPVVITSFYSGGAAAYILEDASSNQVTSGIEALDIHSSSIRTLVVLLRRGTDLFFAHLDGSLPPNLTIVIQGYSYLDYSIKQSVIYTILAEKDDKLFGISFGFVSPSGFINFELEVESSALPNGMDFDAVCGYYIYYV